MKPLLKLFQICAAGMFIATQAPAATDPNKTVRVAFWMAETSYDNAFASDEMSQDITGSIFESMLQYDYLARPLKLVPRTLAKMPEISDGGKTMLFTLQKGILFANDPAFNGKPRELIAADYAYALKRLMDPKVKSPWFFLVEGKISGANEARAAAQKTGKFDYDGPMPGLEIVDRYTLRVRLIEQDYNFIWVLAMPSTGASAREVVEKYGDAIGAHPVGTGSFILGDYKRSSKTVLLANPNFRPLTWQWKSDVPEDQAMIKAMTGKPVPSVGRVEISVIEEGQAQWLAFLGAQQDYISPLHTTVLNVAKTGTTIKPEFAAKGITLQRRESSGLWYELFNMEDPVVGGYTKERIALRRAISLAFPLDEHIRVIEKGDQIPMNGILPSTVTGFNKNRPRAHLYDVAMAKALLDRFGYKDRDGDGWREQPDGSPLEITRNTGTSTVAREENELLKKAMDAIGIKVKFFAQKAPDRRIAAREGKITFTKEGWNADYPDAHNFLQLLSEKSYGAENYSRFRLKEFDSRFEKISAMPQSPERDQLIDEMQDYVHVYAPWFAPRADVTYSVIHPWLLGYKKHPLSHENWEYLDIDLSKKPGK